MNQVILLSDIFAMRASYDVFSIDADELADG